MKKDLMNTQTTKTSIKMFRLFLFLALFLGIFDSAKALSSEKLKPTELTWLLEQGDKAYDHFKYSIAVECYEAYLQESEKTDENVLVKLSDSYWRMREYEKARRVLAKLAFSGSVKLTNQQKIRLSELEARLGNYNQAAVWLQGIPGYESKAEGYKDAVSIENSKEDSVDWHVNYLNLNTNFREFSPLLAGQDMIFTSNHPSSRKASSWDGKGYARLWVLPIQKISSKPINQAFKLDNSVAKKNVSNRRLSLMYEGTTTIQQGDNAINNLKNDQKTTMIGHLVGGMKKLKFNVATAALDSNNNLYFSANQRPKRNDKTNRIVLMNGKYDNGKVKNIQNVLLGDTSKFSTMHPAVNKSGTLLVFSSDKAGGKGGFDLYYTKRTSINDSWSTPVLLSSLINTAGNEVFPSLSPDGYLYFSSDARAGLGGLDIYRISFENALKGIGQVEHLGYPINSSSDDFDWTQNKTDKTGYFTSDRYFGNDNIYSFKYDPQPKISHIVGNVRAKFNEQPMPGATVFLYNKATNEVFIHKTDAKGRYVFDIKNTGDFVLKSVVKNYKDDCFSYNIPSKIGRNITYEAPRDFFAEVPSKPSLVLDNIFYDFDKWNIRPDARPTLDSLVKVLKRYPAVPVELSSYCDSRGRATYNDTLSQRRAESAVAYIVSKGIDPGRITAKGYGETRLINQCSDGVTCTEAEHQVNRRTEIRVIQSEKPVESIDPVKYKDGDILNPKDLPNDFFNDCK